jgi:signal transduction histidine kinase
MISFHGSANTLGLFFFSSMSASMSHEIRNAVAIVNEQAGLLEDLTELAEQGRPLNLERLRTLSADIRNQVQRTDEIAGRLNRFAHSARQPVIATDTTEIFAFTAALADRLATMNCVTITVGSGTAVPLQVRPFMLENLLWICLKCMFSLSSGDHTVEMSALDADCDVVLQLQFDQGVPVGEIGEQAAQEGQPLLVALRAVMNSNVECNLITLRMPKQFEE